MRPQNSGYQKKGQRLCPLVDDDSGNEVRCHHLELHKPIDIGLLQMAFQRDVNVFWLDRRDTFRRHSGIGVPAWWQVPLLFVATLTLISLDPIPPKKACKRSKKDIKDIILSLLVPKRTGNDRTGAS
jgi:hypothetical protein